MIVYRELRSIEKDLGFSARTLYGLSNSLEKHYHTVYIPKSDGSKRKLSVPDLILKSVQRSIADNILFQNTQKHINREAAFKKMRART